MSIFIAFISAVFNDFGHFEDLKLSLTSLYVIYSICDFKVIRRRKINTKNGPRLETCVLVSLEYLQSVA